MTAVTAINGEVLNAVAELRDTFPDTDVEVTPDGDGGAWITIAKVDLGPTWTPSTTWLGFHILNNYPYGDVYPHFIDAAPRLGPSGALPRVAVTTTQYQVDQRPCLQVSRRSNHWDPNHDTAAIKAAKVIDWLRQQ